MSQIVQALEQFVDAGGVQRPGHVVGGEESEDGLLECRCLEVVCPVQHSTSTGTTVQEHSHQSGKQNVLHRRRASRGGRHSHTGIVNLINIRHKKRLPILNDDEYSQQATTRKMFDRYVKIIELRQFTLIFSGLPN